MTFTPHNPNHAVQSTVFELFFLPVSADRAVARSDFAPSSKALATLPGTRPVQTMNLTIEDGKPTAPSIQQGVELFLAEPDGTSAWSLQVSAGSITIACRVYTRWKHVWEKASSYMQEALSALRSVAQADLEIDRIEMRVIDRFVADSRSYDVRSLLVPSPYLAELVFDTGPAWHSHVGWFGKSPFNTLHNLNVDAKPVIEKKEDGKWEIDILHFQRVKPLDGDELKNRPDILQAIFTAFHAQNKQVISSIISPSMRGTIGLNEAT